MRLVSCQGGVLRTLTIRSLPGGAGAAAGRACGSFVAGPAAPGALPPGGGVVRGGGARGGAGPPPPRLTRVGARRLQLAAEAGGGVGLLLRPARSAQHYAAATRWLVAPTCGEASVQRWRVELVHGHGGRVGRAVL